MGSPLGQAGIQASTRTEQGDTTLSWTPFLLNPEWKEPGPRGAPRVSLSVLHLVNPAAPPLVLNPVGHPLRTCVSFELDDNAQELTSSLTERSLTEAPGSRAGTTGPRVQPNTQAHVSLALRVQNCTGATALLSLAWLVAAGMG